MADCGFDPRLVRKDVPLTDLVAILYYRGECRKDYITLAVNQSSLVGA